MKIISGGQIGADLAALEWAKQNGLETGGWMPKGFKNKNGDNPDFGEKFGMIETNDGGYPARTRLNVEAGDITLRFGSNFSTYGELCTARFIKQFMKPHLDIPINPMSLDIQMPYIYVADWIRVYRPEVINVAGNARREFEGVIKWFLDRTYGILKMYST